MKKPLLVAQSCGRALASTSVTSAVAGGGITAATTVEAATTAGGYYGGPFWVSPVRRCHHGRHHHRRRSNPGRGDAGSALRGAGVRVLRRPRRARPTMARRKPPPVLTGPATAAGYYAAPAATYYAPPGSGDYGARAAGRN